MSTTCDRKRALPLVVPSADFFLPADGPTTPVLHLQLFLARRRLIRLDQVADPLGISFAMPVTGDRIGSARRVNADIRPQNTGRNLYRRDLRNRDTLFHA